MVSRFGRAARVLAAVSVLVLAGVARGERRRVSPGLGEVSAPPAPPVVADPAVVAAMVRT